MKTRLVEIIEENGYLIKFQTLLFVVIILKINFSFFIKSSNKLK